MCTPAAVSLGRYMANAGQRAGHHRVAKVDNVSLARALAVETRIGHPIAATRFKPVAAIGSTVHRRRNDAALVAAAINEKGTRTLAGLDTASGEALWQHSLGVDHGRCGAAAPDPAGGALVALGKRVVRVSPQTGAMSDLAELPGDITSLLPVSADLLVVATSIKGIPAIIALDPTDGRERWRQPSQDQLFAAALAPDGKRLALALGQLAMGGGKSNAHGPPVLVVDPATGVVVAGAGALRETQWGILYAADGRTIISGGSGGAIRYWQAP